jgi:hypothetical protein
MFRALLIVSILSSVLMARSLLEINSDFDSHEVSFSQLSGGKNYPTFWSAGILLAENSDNDSGMMLYGSMLKTASMGGNWIVGYGARLAWIDGEDGNKDFNGIAIPLRVKAIYRVPVKHPIRLSAEYASAPRMLTSGDIGIYDELRLEGNFYIAPKMYGFIGLRQLYIDGFETDSPEGDKDLFEYVDGGFVGFKYYF